MADVSYLDDLGLSAEAMYSRISFYQNLADRGAELDRLIVAAISDRAPASLGASKGAPTWLEEASRAVALARATQLALLVDFRAGLHLIGETGRTYSAIGIPFGYALLGLVNRGESAWPSPIGTETAAERSLTSTVRSTQERRGAEAVAEAMRYPGQQTYLLMALALAGNESAAGLIRDEDHGLHNSGAAVGPNGNSIGDYWSFLKAVFDRTVERGELMLGATALARPYAQSIRRAKRNSYSWERLESPVDLVDLDVVILSAIMAFRHNVTEREVREWTSKTERDPLEAIPVAIGCRIAENAGPGRGSRRAPAPPKPAPPAPVRIKQRIVRQVRVPF